MTKQKTLKNRKPYETQDETKENTMNKKTYETQDKQKKNNETQQQQ